MTPARTRLAALAAQRTLALAGLMIGPAVAAGVIAALHTGQPGSGALVGASVFACAFALDRKRYPLHLMPLAGALAHALAPLGGVVLAFMISLTLSPLSPGDLFAPLLGAWMALAIGLGLAAVLNPRLAVRIGVIGSPSLADSLTREFELADVPGYEVAGWVDFTDDEIFQLASGPYAPHLGSVARLEQLVRRNRIDLLVFGVRESEKVARRDFGVTSLDVLDRVSAACLGLDVRVIGATQLFEEMFGHVPLATMNAAWFQYMLHPRFRRTSPIGKRVIDLCAAALIGILTAPLLAVAAIAIKLTDRGPVLYRQPRAGARGQPFDVLKLRTMHEDAEASGKPQWAKAVDGRVTGVGRILRRLHIDELPQLWNVARGQMSVVGPRPERPEFVAALERDLTFYDRRVLVKPGITGWAQVRCGYAGTEAGAAWKLAHDLYYLKHRSASLDLLIMIETLLTPKRDIVQLARTPDDRFVLEALHGEA